MKTREIVLCGLFAGLTATTALFIIPLPFSPVPITLQLIFTFLAGALLGRKLGFISQLIYLFMGAIGLPVFAGGIGGFGALVGPTAGYLYGFCIAAYLAGFGKKTFSQKFIYFSLGLLCIYSTGIIGLIINTSIDLPRAIAIGVTPFIPGDLFKVILASYLYVKIPLNTLD
jgi:biotin transport system substrate-specific component